MRTKSIGFRTDLMLAAFDGEVSRGDGYIVARTPSCPEFWWGNFVLFPDPPDRDSVERWEAIFDREVGRVPGVRHRNLAWDAVDGEHGAAHVFVANGYSLTESVFLTAEDVAPPAHHRDDVHTRPIETDDDWHAALEIALHSFDPSPDFQAFQKQQMRRNRRLVDTGHGQWFGAFIGGAMVATVGLYANDGLARCQGVATAPEERRNGYCGTMMHSVCEYAFTRMGARQIVIMAEPGGAAERVYRSVGFKPRERVSSLSVSLPGGGG